MSLTPQHANAVSQSHYTTVEAIQIKLPDHTINLISAASTIRFLVGTTLTTFTGSDELFGRIGSIGEVGYSMDASAPVWKLSVLINGPAAIAALCDPAAQGSVVQYWTVVINQKTGAVISAFRLWKGRMDTAIVSIGESQRVDLDIITPTDLLMIADEGERLTVAWQDLHFPGQRGLEFNTDAALRPDWGTEKNANPIGSGNGSGGGSGGGGSGGGGNYQQQLW